MVEGANLATAKCVMVRLVAGSDARLCWAQNVENRRSPVERVVHVEDAREQLAEMSAQCFLRGWHDDFLSHA